MQQNALVALLIGITLVVIGIGWAGHCIYDRHIRLGIKNDRAHTQGQNGPRDLERGHGSPHIPDYTHDAWIRPSRRRRTPYITKPGYVMYKSINRGVNRDWARHDSRPPQEDNSPLHRKDSQAPRQKQRKQQQQQQRQGNKNQAKKRQTWKNKQNKKNSQSNQDHSYWGNTNNYQGNQNEQIPWNKPDNNTNGTTCGKPGWENTNNNDNNGGGGYQNGNTNQSHKGSSSQKEDNMDEWRPKNNQSRKSHSQNQDGSDRQLSKKSWGSIRNENDRQSNRNSRGIPQRRQSHDQDQERGSNSLRNYGDPMDSQVGWGKEKEDVGEAEAPW